MSGPRLVLYHSATSVCSQKVRLVLADLGLNWDGHLLDLARGDQFEPDYLALNPRAVVPTLLIDGRCVVESNVIMKELSDLRPESALSLLSRANPAMTCKWLERSLDLHKAINALTYAAVNRTKLQALPKDKLEERYSRIPDETKRRRLRQIVEYGFESEPVTDALMQLRCLLPDIGRDLKKAPWLAGERPGTGDFAVLPFVFRLELLGLDFLWAADNPHLETWFDRLKEWPCFDRAINAFLSAKALEKFSLAAPACREELKKRVSVQ